MHYLVNGSLPNGSWRQRPGVFRATPQGFKVVDLVLQPRLCYCIKTAHLLCVCARTHACVTYWESVRAHTRHCYPGSAPPLRASLTRDVKGYTRTQTSASGPSRPTSAYARMSQIPKVYTVLGFIYIISLSHMTFISHATFSSARTSRGMKQGETKTCMI